MVLLWTDAPRKKRSGRKLLERGREMVAKTKRWVSGRAGINWGGDVDPYLIPSKQKGPRHPSPFLRHCSSSETVLIATSLIITYLTGGLAAGKSSGWPLTLLFGH